VAAWRRRRRWWRRGGGDGGGGARLAHKPRVHTYKRPNLQTLSLPSPTLFLSLSLILSLPLYLSPSRSFSLQFSLAVLFVRTPTSFHLQRRYISSTQLYPLVLNHLSAQGSVECPEEIVISSCFDKEHGRVPHLQFSSFCWVVD